MRNIHQVVLLFLGSIAATAGYLTLRSFGLFAGPVVAEVRPVPAGCREVAWISPATSYSTWERMVEAADHVQALWQEAGKQPGLKVDRESAFPRASTDVPEVAIWPEGRPGEKLLLRWYKMSSEVDMPAWVARLAARDPAPVAVVGGESTHRAVEISQVLAGRRGRWHGPDPLFLITTATADAYSLQPLRDDESLTDPGRPKLMDIYSDRTFRFSFSNARMTKGVMDFVQDHPELWGSTGPLARLAAAAAGVADPWAAAALVQAERGSHNYTMYAVSWGDDEYSKDLRDRFVLEFRDRHPTPLWNVATGRIPNSIGDFANPNTQDIYAVCQFLDIEAASKFLDLPAANKQSRQLLVLPTGAQRARRFLRALVNSAPVDARGLVVVSGDSITFNHLYRDRKLAWNVLDLPVPVVIFSHRNPIDRGAGFLPEGSAARPWASTGTQDLLFYRDLIEALALGIYGDGGPPADADGLAARLRGLHWSDGRLTLRPEGVPLFDDSRDRSEGTGEHIVVLLPDRKGALVDPSASISVWSREGHPGGRSEWKLYGRLDPVLYMDPQAVAEPPLEGVIFSKAREP